MNPVEILPIQDALVLRARGSELLILAQHVTELKQRKTPRDFSMYFTGEALVNRPARKLFESWLRKDESLWRRLFHMVHEGIDALKGDEEESSPEVKAEQVEPTAKPKSAPASTAKNLKEAGSKPVKTADKAPAEKLQVEKTSDKKASSKQDKQAAKSSAAKPEVKKSAPVSAGKKAGDKARAKTQEKVPAKSSSKSGSKVAAKSAKKSPAGKPASKSSSSKKR